MADPMQYWDYHLEPDSVLPVERLNALGAAGWELVAIERGGESAHVFRRPAQSFVERVTLEQRARYYRSLGLDPETGQ